MAKKRKKKRLPITKLFTQEEVNQMIQEEIDKLDNLPNLIDAEIKKYLPDALVLGTIRDAHQAKNAWRKPDWGNRLRAADLASKLKGMHPAEKHEITGKNGGAIEGKITIEFVKGLIDGK